MTVKKMRLLRIWRNEKGAIIPLLAVSIFALVAILALAVDLGKAYLTKASLERLANLAAMAGIKRFALENRASPDFQRAIQRTIEVTAQRNQIVGQSSAPVVTAADVSFGVFDFNNPNVQEAYRTSTVTDPDINAVRVRLQQRLGGPNAPMVFHFARLLGFDQLALSSQASSVFAPRFVVIAFDNSNSQQYQSHNSNPSSCPTALPPWNIKANRYFIDSARSFYDPVNCFGLPTATIHPEPLDSEAGSIQNTLLRTKLFTTGFYQSGFVVFGSSAQQVVPLADRNALDIENTIRQARGEWRQYASTDRANPPYASMIIPPGGTSPQATGHTNIGHALEMSIDALNSASASFNVETVKLVILITDGQPDCGNSDPASCNFSAPGFTAGQAYAMAQADRAKSDRVIVYGIYFDSDTSTTCASNPPGFIFLNDLSRRTEGRAFCANNTTQLANIFNSLPTPFASIEIE